MIWICCTYEHFTFLPWALYSINNFTNRPFCVPTRARNHTGHRDQHRPSTRGDEGQKCSRCTMTSWLSPRRSFGSSECSSSVEELNVHRGTDPVCSFHHHVSFYSTPTISSPCLPLKSAGDTNIVRNRILVQPFSQGLGAIGASRLESRPSMAPFYPFRSLRWNDERNDMQIYAN